LDTAIADPDRRFTSGRLIIGRYLLIIKRMRRKAGALIPIEEAILAVLAQMRRRGVAESHGYDIAQHLRDVSDAKLLTAYGTLYRALGRLEKMGLLESRWEDPRIAAREARPGRRLYALTGAGAEAVRNIAIASGRAAVRRRQAARA
jgi:PadR family transcriptional regulator PadR